jgi:hypothetical protein
MTWYISVLSIIQAHTHLLWLHKLKRNTERAFVQSGMTAQADGQTHLAKMYDIW